VPIARIVVILAIALFVLTLLGSPAHAADPQPSGTDAAVAVADSTADAIPSEPGTEGEGAPDEPPAGEADPEGDGAQDDPPPSEPDPGAEGDGAQTDPPSSEPDTGADAPVAVAGVAARTGECVDGTGRIEFHATVTGPGGATVGYHWLWSDGGIDTNPRTITRPASGTATVTTTWDRGEGSGWAALQITSPSATTSERAEFTLTCAQEQTVQVAEVTASVGECVDGIGRIEFRATITGPAGATVGYHWLRSDGGVDTDPQTITLPASGTATVTRTWDRGEGSGWQALQVTSPTEITSERAHVTLDCEREPDVAVTDVVASVGECTDGIGRIEFRATITGPAGTSVTYHWLRDDGAIDTNPQTITLPASGTATVTTTWDRGEGSGWQALQITSPTEITSERAHFTLDCDESEGTSTPDTIGTVIIGTNGWKIPVGAPQTGGGEPRDEPAGLLPLAALAAVAAGSVRIGGR